MTNITPTNTISAMIPEVFSKKLARQNKQYTRFIERNCNRNWEGAITGFGDVVNIALPKADKISVAITGQTTDVCPVATGVTAESLKLTINNVATFSMKFSDTEQVQSQFNLLDGYGALAMQKLGDMKDKQVMKYVIDKVVTTTAGTNLIGTAAAPRAVTKDNIYDYVVDLAVILTETGALNGDGYYTFAGNEEEPEYLLPVLTVTPKIFGLMLKSTQLTHPTAAGDEVVKRGEQSMMGGFEIDKNTVLANFTSTDVKGLAEGAQVCIASTKMATTYANQLTKVEKLRDPDCFADIVRGIELYGFEVIHPEAAAVAFFKIGAATV
jgi:hypothetical protein